jgi:thymidylate synthase
MTVMISASSAAGLFTAATGHILRQGRLAGPRGMATREVLGVQLHLTDPRRRLIHLPPSRLLNAAFAVAEAMWIISGSDDPWIFDFNRALVRYADGGVLRGAYGPRLRRWHGIDQLDRARLQLHSDPDSRRAVVQLFDPARDLDGGSDVPCTLGYRFFLRDGRLNMHTSMRSNDLWLGLPYDIFTATLIQELMAGWLGVELGDYRHSVDSLHLYAEHFDQAALVPEHAESEPMAPIAVAWPRLDATLAATIHGDIADLPTGSLWADFANAMGCYRQFRAGERDSGRAMAEQVGGPLGVSLRAWLEHLTPVVTA